MMTVAHRLPGRRSWTLGLVLLACAVAVARLQPVPPTEDQAAAGVDLEAMIPAEFAGWRLAPAGAVLQVQPELKTKVEATYASTLGRTYVDRQGRRIMLSIAYGGNQLSDRVQAHRPEFCYKAQGFDLFQARDDRLATDAGDLPLRRLLATRPGRSEPISYWMTMGDRAILPGLGRKLAQLRHGLTGDVPDGLLIRISSLDRDTNAAFNLHDRFIRDLALAVTERGRLGFELAMVAGTAR